MEQFIFVTHVCVSVILVILILLQQGKGSEMGASFGGGSSQSVFGSKGAGSFLVKVTALLAGVFFITSLGLGYQIAERHRLGATPKQHGTELSPRKKNLPNISDEIPELELD